MKILITGAGGFIGSHLVEYCVKQGHEVTALVHYNANSNWGWLDRSSLKGDFRIVAGDVRDYDFVYSVMKSVDAVFHLAALIGIPYSYVSPIAYVRTNIEGTYNILESARHRVVEQVMVTSTSEAYGTAQYVPVDEAHPLNAQSPYAATKIGADHLALSFYRSFDLPVKIVRPFNTYGPRQSARAIIPTVIAQILHGQKRIELGNLSPTRDLTFVKDTAEGFVEILQTDRLFGEVTNIGMNEEISIRDLVDLIVDLMDGDIEIISQQERVRPGKSEVERLRCDNAKIMTATSWRPCYDLNRGLAETIEWIQSHLAFYKPEIYNV